MVNERKYLLIDGHSLAFRAFYALPDTMTTAQGQPVNAVYGFASMLFKVLFEEKPYAVAVSFDGPRKELNRVQVYPEYKSHRPPMPEELRSQMELIEALLGEMEIPILRARGYEADDLLGAAARRISSNGWRSTIVTGDRDLLQLIDDSTTVLMTGKGISETVRYDKDAVMERYGVPPASLPDIAALKGDPSDNIPGVPGIGEKGACSLISEFGSLEGLYESIDAVSGEKRRESLLKNREIAFLSKELALIDTEAPVDYPEDEQGPLKIGSVETVQYLRSLEFRTLANRYIELFGAGSGLEVDEAAEKHSFLTVAPSGEGAADFLEQARTAGAVGLAVDGTGSTWCDLTLESVAICCGERILVAVPGDPVAWEAVESILASASIEKSVPDSKIAIEMLGKAGTRNLSNLFDCSLAGYIENPSLGDYSLDRLWERCLSCPMDIDGKEGLPEEEEQLALDYSGTALTPGEDLRAVAYDAARAFLLAPVMKERLEASGGAMLFAEIEMPLAYVFARMEERGVGFDGDALKRFSSQAGARLAEIENEVFRLAGHSFNLASTQQLATVLFEERKLPPGKKTKSGYSTDSTVLESLKDADPIVELVLEYRERSKLKSTYFDVLPRLVCAETGRLHARFNQTGTSTGRISSNSPNLQNIPVRTVEGREIRSAFVPSRPGWKLIIADYSQIELRVLAHMSGDERLLEAFLKGEDIHAQTAAWVFGVDPDEVTSEMRRTAKIVNFGVVYGMGYFGLSSRLGIPVSVATEYIDSYFRNYEGVRRFRDSCIEEAEERGYVETMFGRRRYLPELKSRNRQKREFGERLAVNTPLQGTAADIIKKAMVALDEALSARVAEAGLLIQIHDELVVEAPGERAEDVRDILVDCMSSAADLSVPLDVECGIFGNWGEAKA